MHCTTWSTAHLSVYYTHCRPDSWVDNIPSQTGQWTLASAPYQTDWPTNDCSCHRWVGQLHIQYMIFQFNSNHKWELLLLILSQPVKVGSSSPLNGLASYYFSDWYWTGWLKYSLHLHWDGQPHRFCLLALSSWPTLLVKLAGIDCVFNPNRCGGLI